MDPLVLDLALILLLVLVNAAFSGTELAVVSLRRSQLVRLAETEGRRGRTLLALSEEPTSFLSTIQVGITLAGFLASATAAVSLAAPLEPVLEGALGRAAKTASIMIVTLLLTYVTLVFGELVPKRIAMRRPERWALRAALPVAFIARVARPLVWLLARSTTLVARPFGAGDDTASTDLLTDEEVLDVIATESSIPASQRGLLERVLELRERTVREVLVPRRDLFVLDAESTIDDAISGLSTNGFTRAPVAAGADVQEPIAVAVLGHLLCLADPTTTTLRDALRLPPTIVPENALVLDVLRLLQRAHRQVALVADEHGTILGMVTVEDLLEEIVGEVYDELDRDLAPDDSRGYRLRDDGWFELPGTYPVHDLPDLGLDVPADSTAATVAGLLMDALGALPAEGDEVRCGNVRLVAELVDGTAIERVLARRV